MKPWLWPWRRIRSGWQRSAPVWSKELHLRRCSTSRVSAWQLKPPISAWLIARVPDKCRRASGRLLDAASACGFNVARGESRGFFGGMMRLYLWFLGLASLLLAALPAEARPRDDALAGAFRCAVIGDARAWLDCYYGAAQPVRAGLGLAPAMAAQVKLAL